MNDYERLSAYIDGELTDTERAALENQLDADPDLRQALHSLRQTVLLLRQMPELKAPRNFTLTRDMVEQRPVLPFPLTFAFSALSAAAAVVLLAFGGYFLLRTGFSPQAAMPITAQQPAPAAAFLPTGTPAPTQTALSLTLPEAASRALSANAADELPAETDTVPPISLVMPGDEQSEAQGGAAMLNREAEDATAQAPELETFMFDDDEAPSAEDRAEFSLEAAADLAADDSTAMATQAAFAPPAATPLMSPAGTATVPAEPTQVAQMQPDSPDEEAVIGLAEPAARSIAQSELPAQASTDADATGIVLLLAGAVLLAAAIITTAVRRRRLAA